MKAKIHEWGSSINPLINIQMEPENIEELLIFLRYVENAKAKKPDIYLSLNDGILSITLHKIHESVQKASICK